MAPVVLALRHSVEERDEDGAAEFLLACGWRVRSVYPVAGETLPDPADPALGAVIVYGGLQSANDSGADSPIPAELAWIERWLGTGKPYFGICLGAQLLARVLGAEVCAHPRGLHEIGFCEVAPLPGAAGFLPRAQHFYQWHHENFAIPRGGRALATGAVYANQAFACGDKVYGVQFHPEVTRAMLQSWLAQNGDELAHCPGAHAAARQLADAERHLQGASVWLQAFLAQWLGLEPRVPAPVR